jgi:hypothetical protein
MSNQCKNCTLSGNIEQCEKVECSQHDSWYVEQLEARVKELEVESESSDILEKTYLNRIVTLEQQLKSANDKIDIMKFDIEIVRSAESIAYFDKQKIEKELNKKKFWANQWKEKAHKYRSAFDCHEIALQEMEKEAQKSDLLWKENIQALSAQLRMIRERLELDVPVKEEQCCPNQEGEILIQAIDNLVKKEHDLGIDYGFYWMREYPTTAIIRDKDKK